MKTKYAETLRCYGSMENGPSILYDCMSIMK